MPTLEQEAILRVIWQELFIERAKAKSRMNHPINKERAHSISIEVDTWSEAMAIVERKMKA